MFQEVEVRKYCMECGGAGKVWSPDLPDPFATTSTGSSQNQAHHAARKDFETVASEWIFAAVFIAVAYFGITETDFEWYWSVGAGFLSGLACQKLMNGPFRFVLTGLKYVLLATLVGAGLILAIYLL